MRDNPTLTRRTFESAVNKANPGSDVRGRDGTRHVLRLRAYVDLLRIEVEVDEYRRVEVRSCRGHIELRWETKALEVRRGVALTVADGVNQASA